MTTERPLLQPQPGWKLVPPDGGPWVSYARRSGFSGVWETRWLSTSSNDPGRALFEYEHYQIPWPFGPDDGVIAEARDFEAIGFGWVDVEPLRDPRVDPRDGDEVLVSAHDEEGRRIRACRYRVESREEGGLLYTTDSPAGRGYCCIETWQRMVVGGEARLGGRRG